jgi:CarD family transcriptional regulator
MSSTKKAAKSGKVTTAKTRGKVGKTAAKSTARSKTVRAKSAKSTTARTRTAAKRSATSAKKSTAKKSTAKKGAVKKTAVKKSSTAGKSRRAVSSRATTKKTSATKRAVKTAAKKQATASVAKIKEVAKIAKISPTEKSKVKAVKSATASLAVSPKPTPKSSTPAAAPMPPTSETKKPTASEAPHVTTNPSESAAKAVQSAPIAPVSAAPAPVQSEPAAKPAAAPTAKPAAPAKARPAAQKLGFRLSEFIVYPAHGVGQIVGIEVQEVAGFSLELFVVSFAKDKMILKVPTSKVVAVGMRKLAEAEIVEKALVTLSGRARVKRTMWSRRAQEYEAKINSGDLVTISEVVRDLYRSESQPEQSYSERQLYEAALDRMAREISAVRKLIDSEALKVIETYLAKGPRRGSKNDLEVVEEGGDDSDDVERAA